MSKKRNLKRFAVIFCFIVYFIYGSISVKDYGVSIDELMERTSSLVTYKYLVPSVENISTESVNFAQIEPLSEWRDRYYGVALQLPMVMVEHFTGFTMPMGDVLYMRHLYVFLLFFISAIFIYKIAMKISGDEIDALIGTAIFVLCPRIFGHSFFNIKDLVFLSAFVVNLYFCIAFIEKTGWKTMIALAISTAFCVNTRIVGAILIASSLVIVFFKYIFKKEKCKETLFFIGMAGIASVLAYIIITPVTWSNPIREIYNIYHTFSNYTTWDGACYYLGQYIESTSLPWHYIPVWILCTVPLSYLLLSLVGIADSVSYGRKDSNRYLIACALILPLAYVIIRRPVLYNGWRHFYFIWVPLSILAVYGFNALRRVLADTKGRYIPYVYVALSLGFILFRIAMYHPFEWAYFNPFIERYAENNLEKDYWAITPLNSYKFIKDNQTEGEFYNIQFPFWEYTYNWLGKEESKYFKRVDQGAADTDYIILHQPAGSVYDPTWNYATLYPREYVETAGEITLGEVAYGLWDEYSYSRITEKKDSITYNINGISWDRIINDTKQCLVGELSSAINTGKIVIECSDTNIVKDTDILIAGENGIFKDIEDIADVEIKDGFIYVTLTDIYNIQKINLQHRVTDRDICWNINFYRKKYDSYNSDFVVRSPFDIAASTENNIEYPVDYAIDNNDFTKWMSNGSQSEGMVFAFTLDKRYQLSGISILYGVETYDYPRNLKIYLSEDEANWTEVQYNVSGNTVFTFEPVSCRYVRLVLGEVKDTTNNWTMRELVLFETK